MASGTAWLIAEPATSGAPAAITQSAPPGVLSAVPASSAGAGDDAGQRTRSNPTPTVEAVAGSDQAAKVIEVKTPLEAAKPFETVPIRGAYRGGGETFLEVQRWADGTWQTFPVPAKTDASGQFTAYVELGLPSHYQLRLRDPRSGVKSEPFTLVIKG